MRVLRFIVDGQTITKDPDCDFEGIVPGTEGYLKARFVCSEEWKSMGLVASFWSPMGKEYTPQLVLDGVCTIPSEALENRKFKVQLMGCTKRDGEVKKLVTNKLEVEQNGGKV